MPKLIHLLRELDEKLTGKSKSHPDVDERTIAEKAIGGAFLWHLSDGGYSRIRIRWDDTGANLELTDSSTDRVRKRWLKTLDLRTQIETRLSERVEELLREGGS